MKVEWYYLKPDDYSTIIKKVKNFKLKNQLYSQYIGRIPMLKSSYLNLKKKYGQYTETTSSN